MEAEEADGGQLLGPREVGDVVAVVAGAGIAGAALDEGLAIPLPAGLAEVETEALRGVGDQRGAVAGEAGGDRAVEDVEAEGDAGHQVVDVADPEQVLRRPRWAGAARSARARPCISSLSRPSVPPIAIPSTAESETACADSRRRSSWMPPWTIPNTAWRSGPLRRRATRGSGRASDASAPSSARCTRGRRGRACTRRRRGAMSEPSLACTSIETSGEMNSSEPSR